MQQPLIEYIALEENKSIKYNKEILNKYHKISESKLSLPFINETIRQLYEDIYGGDTLILKDKIRLAIYTDKTNENNRLTLFEYPPLTEEEEVKFSTLVYIVWCYIKFNYPLFIREKTFDSVGYKDKESINWDNDLSKSDKEIHDENQSSIENAYSILKRLETLLILEKSQANTLKVTFNSYEKRDIGNEVKKNYLQKEKQVVIDESTIVGELIKTSKIELIRILRDSTNPYINSLLFRARKNIDIQMVKKELANIGHRATSEGKQTSSRIIFKGYLKTLISHYIKKEKVTFNENEITDREVKLITYDLLSKFGFISNELINKYTTDRMKIGYIKDLPQWRDNIILEQNHSYGDFSRDYDTD